VTLRNADDHIVNQSSSKAVLTTDAVAVVWTIHGKERAFLLDFKLSSDWLLKSSLRTLYGHQVIGFNFDFYACWHFNWSFSNS
jgi:hypothetical protein